MKAELGSVTGRPRLWRVAGLAALVLLSVGCRQDMHDQAKYKTYKASTFFPDGKSARPLPAHTVARGFLREDTEFYTGLDAARQPVAEFPFEVTAEVLHRGQQRFNIFCTPCHDRVGTGNGMIVKRGYKQAASFHQDRLREVGPGYFVNVMTEGFGTMPSYAKQIPPRDRWAIAAYIRALQLSQNAQLSELPGLREEVTQALAAAAQPASTEGEPHAPAAH